MAKTKSNTNMNILLKAMLGVNLLFSLAIVGAVFSSKTNPLVNVFPAFLGLAYPILLYSNLFFVFFWILLRKKLFLISVVAILITMSLLPKYFQLNTSRTKELANIETFTVVSYNIQSFRTFYHHQSQSYLDSLTAFLEEMKPSVVCFQEYYNDLEMDEDITHFMQRRLGLKYKYINSRLTRWDRYEFGLAVFSEFPILNTGRILNANYEDELYTTNYAVYADLLIQNDTFRLYNVHLESVKISEDESIFQTLEDGAANEFKNESKKLFSKLKTAFQFRANQIIPIREHMDASPYPLIVCGDFNDTPASWAYAQMSRGLQDAFVVAGRGTGKTYNGRYPSFRIDYILTHPNIKIHWFETAKVYYSDHFPVYAVCSLKQNVEETANE